MSVTGRNADNDATFNDRTLDDKTLFDHPLLEPVMSEIRSQSADYTMPSREWFERLPPINQWLLGSGTLCLAMGLFLIAGVPLLGMAGSTVKAAYHPYTSEGKQETCLSHLRRVNDALSMYRQDYDEKLPLAEYRDSRPSSRKEGEKRYTWVAALDAYSRNGEPFVCPTDKGELSRSKATGGYVTSSYGFNPVLFEHKLSSASSGIGYSQTLLLADRGEAHDVILLPPFTGWPSPAESKGDRGEAQGKMESNLDFRHSSGQIAILYADGHAGAESQSSWTGEAKTWGGPLLFQASLERLEAQHPLLRQIGKSPAKTFKTQKAKLRSALGQLHHLQKQSVESGLVSEPVEKKLWRGAGVLRLLGDGAFEQQLYRDLQAQSQQLRQQGAGELQLFESDATNGQDNLPAFALRYPSGWKTETKRDGRYHLTYFRPSSPHIQILLERGERQEPTNSTFIDWSGMESSLKKQYGRRYKRIRIGWSTLAGQEVSLWEFELKKPDGPRLRKLYLGHSSTWNSTILTCSAPAGEFRKWRDVFERMRSSFEFRE